MLEQGIYQGLLMCGIPAGRSTSAKSVLYRILYQMPYLQAQQRFVEIQ